jgi:excisionase family DNA binding protein
MSRPDDNTVDCLRVGLLRRGPFQPLRQVRMAEGTSGTTRRQSPWLTPKEAAERARCGVKTIYREVKAGRLRAARVGGRRELRMKPEWVDEWLVTTTTPIELGA